MRNLTALKKLMASNKSLGIVMSTQDKKFTPQLVALGLKYTIADTLEELERQMNLASRPYRLVVTGERFAMVKDRIASEIGTENEGLRKYVVVDEEEIRKGAVTGKEAVLLTVAMDKPAQDGLTKVATFVGPFLNNTDIQNFMNRFWKWLNRINPWDSWKVLIDSTHALRDFGVNKIHHCFGVKQAVVSHNMV